jgi:putative intracellular protease/amidase
MSSSSMATRTAYVFVFDGFADWEPASALAELRRRFGFSVGTFSLATNPIVSMGGIRVMPELRLKDIRPESGDILILPGGDAWLGGEIEEITHLIGDVHRAGCPVAAICAATLSLAHAGLLNEHRHTSNGNGFIAKYAPTYRGGDLYAKVPAITDKNVITANGLAPFAFAAEIFRSIAPDRTDDIAIYEMLYSRRLPDD